ncbi:MAG: flagellar biosynthesis protein FlgN [Spirochaetaceae bacterium]|jgi:hypothetical protein|nr:flagellar biosynthesis protein FlgN [Spirochaetaceae bacterium]
MITVTTEQAVPGMSLPVFPPDSGDEYGTGQAAGRELPAEELDRRTAILKRFRELLLSQRNRFQDYLELLDKQQDLIEQGNPEALLVHVEMEEQIVGDIFSIQRVIDPLEDMYRAAYPEVSGGSPSRNGTTGAGFSGEIGGLKTALEGLKTEAALRLDRNRELLSKRMLQIRSEIKNLRGNPFAARPSIYAGSGAPSLIDIQG